MPRILSLTRIPFALLQYYLLTENESFSHEPSSLIQDEAKEEKCNAIICANHNSTPVEWNNSSTLLFICIILGYCMASNTSCTHPKGHPENQRPEAKQFI